MNLRLVFILEFLQQYKKHQLLISFLFYLLLPYFQGRSFVSIRMSLVLTMASSWPQWFHLTCLSLANIVSNFSRSQLLIISVRHSNPPPSFTLHANLKAVEMLVRKKAVKIKVGGVVCGVYMLDSSMYVSWKNRLLSAEGQIQFKISYSTIEISHSHKILPSFHPSFLCFSSTVYPSLSSPSLHPLPLFFPLLLLAPSSSSSQNSV